MNEEMTYRTFEKGGCRTKVHAIQHIPSEVLFVFEYLHQLSTMYTSKALDLDEIELPNEEGRESFLIV